MRSHPEEGARIIERLGYLDEVVPGIRHHHERLDGRGYPDGLLGDEIPLAARIIHVADSLDAMTTKRLYRDGAQLRGGAGGDPARPRHRLLRAVRRRARARGRSGLIGRLTPVQGGRRRERRLLRRAHPAGARGRAPGDARAASSTPRSPRQSSPRPSRTTASVRHTSAGRSSSPSSRAARSRSSSRRTRRGTRSSTRGSPSRSRPRCCCRRSSWSWSASRSTCRSGCASAIRGSSRASTSPTSCSAGSRRGRCGRRSPATAWT